MKLTSPIFLCTSDSIICCLSYRVVVLYTFWIQVSGMNIMCIFYFIPQLYPSFLDGIFETVENFCFDKMQCIKFAFIIMLFGTILIPICLVDVTTIFVFY